MCVRVWVYFLGKFFGNRYKKIGHFRPWLRTGLANLLIVGSRESPVTTFSLLCVEIGSASIHSVILATCIFPKLSINYLNFSGAYLEILCA
jgi:hypothetical protein